MTAREQLSLLRQHIDADTTLDHASDEYIGLMSEMASVFTRPHRKPQVQEARIAALFERVGVVDPSLAGEVEPFGFEGLHAPEGVG